MENENKNSSNLQEKLSEKINDYFVNVVKDKSKYYLENPNKKPKLNEVKTIISKYSNMNAAISGSLSLIPGPLGLVAALPEIGMVIKNQIDMVFDIGVSLGKESKLKPELLMYIFASAFGNATGSLAIMHGSKLVIKRTSLSVMQKIIKSLAGKITQKLLKSMLAKWLPIAGALIMATWSKVSTTMIGKKAIAIFEIEIEYADEEINDILDTNSNLNNMDNNELDFNKALMYLALIHSDNTIDPKEFNYIIPIIQNESFSNEQRHKLMDTLNKTEKNTFDLELIKKQSHEIMSTIWELISIAKIDNNFHEDEKNFIRMVASEFGFSEKEIDYLLEDKIEPNNSNIQFNNQHDNTFDFDQFENQFIEFLQDIIEDGIINDSERNIIERKRLKLGLTEQRAIEIENHLLGKSKFTDEELKLIEEIEFALEDDGEIDESEMKLLTRKSLKLGINEIRVKELIAQTIQKQGSL